MKRIVVPMAMVIGAYLAVLAGACSGGGEKHEPSATAPPAATAAPTAVKAAEPSPTWARPTNEPSQQLSREAYADPDGFFTIIPPKGWRIQEYSEDPRGKVAFVGPDGAEFRVLAKGLGYGSFADMLKEIREIEKRAGTSMNIEEVTFLGRPAVRRNFTLTGSRILSIDFMEGNVTHNLWYSAPQSQYETYLAVATTSMNTYEATLRGASAEDVRKHAVAHNLRLAQLFLEQGDKGLALEYVEKGLEIDPGNSDLLKLKKEIESE